MDVLTRRERCAVEAESHLTAAFLDQHLTTTHITPPV